MTLSQEQVAQWPQWPPRTTPGDWLRRYRREYLVWSQHVRVDSDGTEIVRLTEYRLGEGFETRTALVAHVLHGSDKVTHVVRDEAVLAWAVKSLMAQMGVESDCRTLRDLTGVIAQKVGGSEGIYVGFAGHDAEPNHAEESWWIPG